MSDEQQSEQPAEEAQPLITAPARFPLSNFDQLMSVQLGGLINSYNVIAAAALGVNDYESARLALDAAREAVLQHHGIMTEREHEYLVHRGHGNQTPEPDDEDENVPEL